jgi:hypothetical protein
MHGFGALLFFVLFLLVVFFPNFEITCLATYYLLTKDRLTPSHLPTYPPNIYIMSMTTNENYSNARIAFGRLPIN